MTETRKIHITSIVGSAVCVGPADAEKVFHAIQSALKAGCKVDISFEGIEDLTSLFLNVAIGQLYKEFPEDVLKERLSVTDASPQDLTTLKSSVDRAKEFFKDPDRFHAAVGEVLGENEA